MKRKGCDRMSKHCTILCAGEIGKIAVPDGSFVICADGGLAHAKKAGVEPDLIVGDFDSFGQIPDGENVRVHPVAKDETDSFLAVDYALERGCTDFLIYGGLGGRFDHTLANVQLLRRLCLCGCRGTLVGADGTRVTAIYNETRTFSPALTGSVGVFSLTPESRGVTIKNLQFEAENVTLNDHTSLGASNAFCGKPAKIGVADGILLITWKE